MVEVPLSQGKTALIDDEDAERVLAHRWTYYFHVRNRKAYAHRVIWVAGGKGKQITVMLHRFIMNAPKGVQVDHKDNDGLNCQKSNLRFASNSQNHQNMKAKRTAAIPFKGVKYDSRPLRRKRYTARIQSSDGINHSLGYYMTATEAAIAYDAKARELHGEFARLNFPRDGEQGART